MQRRPLGGGGHADRPRLDAIGVSADDHSAAAVARVVTSPAATVLDVGCGTGALARRLARDVVPSGRVTALDQDTSAFGDGDGAVDLVRADLTSWSPPDGARYELVHARFVVAHLQDRSAALARMCSWARPGGHLVVTEPIALDLDASVPAVCRRVFGAYHRWAEEGGMSLTFGTAAPGILAGLGAQEITVDSRVSRCGGGPGTDKWAALIAPVAGQLIEYGVAQGDLDDFLETISRPDVFVVPQAIVTTTARVAD